MLIGHGYGKVLVAALASFPVSPLLAAAQQGTATLRLTIIDDVTGIPVLARVEVERSTVDVT